MELSFGEQTRNEISILARRFCLAWQHHWREGKGGRKMETGSTRSIETGYHLA